MPELSRDMRASLERLAQEIRVRARQADEEGRLRRLDDLYIRYMVDDFQCTDKGPVVRGEWTPIVRPDRMPATPCAEISQAVRASSVYPEVVTQLIEFRGTPKTGVDKMAAYGDMIEFVNRLISEYTHNPDSNDDLRDKLIGYLLGLEPMERQEVDLLSGIIVVGRELTVSDGDCRLVLRRVAKEDLEGEFSWSEWISDTLPPHYYASISGQILPSSILETSQHVSFNTVTIYPWHKAITILRFLVGTGVICLSRRVLDSPMGDNSSNSIGHGMSAYSQGRPARERPVPIRDEDVNKAEQFWYRAARLLPPSLYRTPLSSDNESPIAIAYGYYDTALVGNASLHARTAQAVMGLEALFSQSSLDLSYGLPLRIAGLLRYLNDVVQMKGFSPLAIRETLAAAYCVRSAYAHGNPPNKPSNRKKIEQMGGLKQLLHRTLSYLRASLIVMIAIKKANDQKSKEELLNLIDNSLIDEGESQKLQELLKPALELVSLALWPDVI